MIIWEILQTIMTIVGIYLSYRHKAFLKGGIDVCYEVISDVVGQFNAKAAALETVSTTADKLWKLITKDSEVTRSHTATLLANQRKLEERVARLEDGGAK